MVAFARYRDAKYGNRATERREGKSKRGRVDSLGKASAKRVIFYRTSRVLFGFTPIFYQRTHRLAGSVICTLLASVLIRKCFYIFYSSPLSLSWSSQTAKFIRASQFTRSTILRARVVSQSRYWWSRVFRGTRNEKNGKGEKNIQSLWNLAESFLRPSFWQKR